MASNEEHEFFEGREKLLEVWFKTPDGSTHTRGEDGLRQITKDRWQVFLENAKCTILSSIHNDYYDAYVLSESSLFVSRNRVILKTCGTTTLLYCVPKLLELAKEECGITDVLDIFYSRAAFLRPEAQLEPHRQFEYEVNYLDQYFKHGAGYSLGKVNKDTWYLYTLDKVEREFAEADVSFELLMSELDPEKMQQFYKSQAAPGQTDGKIKGHEMTARQVTIKSGIADILPGAKLDDVLFEPCGYSANAIKDEVYFTIHVTPQDDFSYVSFECNIHMKNYDDLIARVVDVFRPKKFVLNIFSNWLYGNAHKLTSENPVAGYAKRLQQFSQFSEFSVNYCQYELGTPGNDALGREICNDAANDGSPPDGAVSR
eukprot:Clim_evm81s215 gene=Clim_evmTU81s215